MERGELSEGADRKVIALHDQFRAQKDKIARALPVFGRKPCSGKSTATHEAWVPKLELVVRSSRRRMIVPSGRKLPEYGSGYDPVTRSDRPLFEGGKVFVLILRAEFDCRFQAERALEVQAAYSVSEIRRSTWIVHEACKQGCNRLTVVLGFDGLAKAGCAKNADS